MNVYITQYLPSVIQYYCTMSIQGKQVTTIVRIDTV